jgi:hypothetical protein
MNKFNLSSGIKDIQNRLIAASIKQTANIDLLRSEEAIKNLINSYTEKFRATEGMLTDISKYVAKSKTVINVTQFNSLFESLYIDLNALYSELESVDNVLSLNLARNKSYFLVIKKRMIELWQRLRLTRLNIYDLNPADESFYETFYSDINIAKTVNLIVDKKEGFVSLKPDSFKIHNQSFEIKNITSTVYPVENEDGGTIHTTNILNTMSGNYSNSGPRDMLQNGLWKEEVICSEIPDMIVNIQSLDDPKRKEYKGVVALVDIEYVYPVPINRLDIDIYGDKPLDVDAVLYKTSDNDSWHVALKEVDDYQLNDTEEVLQYNSVKGRAFDIISFTNIYPITVKVLRLVFNQKNFSYINSPDTKSVNLSEQINKDLSERRYDILKFNSGLEEELTTPVNEENKSIYSKVMSAVESTRNIEDILIKINDILIPELKVSTIDFGTTAKFEVGAWSIEPKYEEYSPVLGKFETKPFTIKDRHLIGASLNAKQNTPGATSINWYIGIEDKDIPILESDVFVRKELINVLDMSSYSNFSSWPGTFFLLDFPADPYESDRIVLYQDGEPISNISNRIVFLNSRLLYFPDIINFSTYRFSIKYPVSIYNCANCYVLRPRTGYDVSSDLVFSLCCTRKEILEQFIKTATYKVGNTSVLLGEHYTIGNALTTTDELQDYFTEHYTTCLFIDNSFLTTIQGYTGTIFEELIDSSQTKYSTTSTDISQYLDNIINGSSDLNIIGSFPNVVPLSTQRRV